MKNKIKLIKEGKYCIYVIDELEKKRKDFESKLRTYYERTIKAQKIQEDIEIPKENDTNREAIKKLIEKKIKNFPILLKGDNVYEINKDFKLVIDNSNDCLDPKKNSNNLKI